MCELLCYFVSVFEQVFDILKGAIIKNFKDEQLLKGSDLVKTLIQDCSSVAQMILDTVKNRSEHETFTEKHQKCCDVIFYCKYMHYNIQNHICQPQWALFVMLVLDSASFFTFM